MEKKLKNYDFGSENGLSYILILIIVTMIFFNGFMMEFVMRRVASWAYEKKIMEERLEREKDPEVENIENVDIYKKSNPYYSRNFDLV